MLGSGGLWRDIFHHRNVTCYNSVGDNTRLTSSNIKEKLGTRVSLGCLSEGGETSWYHNSMETAPISTRDLLVIENIQVNQSGNYYCHGLYTKKSKYFIAKAHIKVYGMLILAIIL